MALLMNTAYKGFDLNAYYKITWVSFNEKWKDELGNKIYNMTLLVNSFTDDTKEYDICQKDYNFETNYAWLNIDNWYTLLKWLAEFATATDC